MNNQKGSVLAICLVILTAITVISAMSMQRSVLQTRIVGNIQHKEAVFKAAMNEQEFWFRTYREAGRNNSTLTAPSNSFIPDANGNRNYTAVPLPSSGNEPNEIQVNNTVTFIASTPNKSVLVEGEEPNNEVSNKLEVRSLITIRNRTYISDQRTGMTYPSLNTSKNSLY